MAQALGRVAHELEATIGGLVDTEAAMIGAAAAERLLHLRPETAAVLVPVMGTLAQVQQTAQQAALGTYPRR